MLLASLLLSAAVVAQGQTTLEWITLTPVNEGFTVKLPAKPDEDTDHVTLMGNSYKMRLYTAVDDADGLLYMVVMQEFPSIAGVLTPTARLEQFMEGFKEGLNKSIGNATTKVDVHADREVDMQGHVGRQFKVTFGETRGLVRAFDASRRVYVLLILGADEKNSKVVRFFDSFEIRPAPAPVPVPVQPPPEVKPS